MRTALSLTTAPLLALLAALAAACGSDAPTPTLPPVGERLAQGAARMNELNSVEFTLTHETGYTPLFAGIELNLADGSVHMPDRAAVNLETRVTDLNVFLEMEIHLDGDDVMMTDPLTGILQPVAATELPIDLRDLGETLGGVLLAIEEPAYSAPRTLDGVESQGIVGSISGAAVQALIRASDASQTARIELWVGSDDLVRRIRLDGRILPNDPPAVVRILDLTAFDHAQPLE